jgi:gas vesicle protein
VSAGKTRRIEMGREESGVGSVVSSFFLGGLIGAGIALLIAPSTGKETREQIRGLAGNVKEKADDYFDQIKEAVTSTLEDGKGLVEEKKRLITSAVQAGIDAYEKKKEEMAEKGG